MGQKTRTRKEGENIPANSHTNRQKITEIEHIREATNDKIIDLWLGSHISNLAITFPCLLHILYVVVSRKYYQLSNLQFGFSVFLHPAWWGKPFFHAITVDHDLMAIRERMKGKN